MRPAEAANWTADFFRHVGRCYVYGLNAECLIMCRGVLDCEFQREVGADQCIELLGERSSGSFSLSDRVRVAQASGLISADEAEAAREVIKAANEAVHRHPGKAANADAFSMIEKTVAVLRGLHGPHDVAEDDSTEDQADF